MARPDKVAKVAEVADRLGQANATVLTEYRGLSVSELQQLRSQLRETEAEYAVVKNTLTRRAAADAGVDIPDELLVGPTAVTFCAGDPVAATKVLKRFSDTHPGLVIKGGILEGNLLGAEETRRLADLESREELLAKLAGMLGTVLAQPARLAQANIEKFARLLAAFQDTKPADEDADIGEESPGDKPAGDEPAGDETAGDETAGDETAGDETPEAETGAETPEVATSEAETSEAEADDTAS